MLACVVVVPRRDWSVYRELSNTVEAVIHCSKQEAFLTQDLETALKKFRPDFISLLQNPVMLTVINLAAMWSSFVGTVFRQLAILHAF